ncbi:MAG: DNA-formamidopyrimidine glycosylase, partial [Euryarchaeota archaeon TMED280]
MPEMPEVETVRRGLTPHLSGSVVTFVDLRRPNLRFPFPDNFEEILIGAKIERIDRRSKYLLFRLSNGYTWMSHLGMTGVWTVGSEGKGKHDHVYFEFDDGMKTAVYTDHRRFGFMDIFETSNESEQKWLSSLGPEPLTDDFTAQVLKSNLHGKRSPIKSALLDQRVVSGLGNIYVSEILFRSKISPIKTASEVAGKSNMVNTKIKRIFENTNQVIAEAIMVGGSTISDFRGVSGDS